MTNPSSSQFSCTKQVTSHHISPINQFLTTWILNYVHFYRWLQRITDTHDTETLNGVIPPNFPVLTISIFEKAECGPLFSMKIISTRARTCADCVTVWWLFCGPTEPPKHLAAIGWVGWWSQLLLLLLPLLRNQRCRPPSIYLLPSRLISPESVAVVSRNQVRQTRSLSIAIRILRD